MTDSQRNKVLDKVRKLFALGDSPNKEEAESAVAKAHELLVRHNLSMQDVDVKDKEFIEAMLFDDKANRPSWQRDLGLIVAHHFMVSFIGTIDSTRAIYVNSGNNAKSYKVVGTTVNVELALYTLNYLLGTYKSLADGFMKETKGIGSIGDRVKMRNSFYLGLNLGLQEALKKQVKSEEERGLVLVKDPDLEKHVDDMCNGRTSQAKRNSDVNPAAAMAGAEAGADIKLRGAVSTDRDSSADIKRIDAAFSK